MKTDYVKRSVRALHKKNSTSQPLADKVLLFFHPQVVKCYFMSFLINLNSFPEHYNTKIIYGSQLDCNPPSSNLCFSYYFLHICSTKRTQNVARRPSRARRLFVILKNARLLRITFTVFC